MQAVAVQWCKFIGLGKACTWVLTTPKQRKQNKPPFGMSLTRYSGPYQTQTSNKYLTCNFLMTAKTSHRRKNSRKDIKTQIPATPS